jgi:hypothetical protein
MTATLYRTTWHEHWPAYRLDNPALRLEIVGALGAKISTLESLRTGRAWLWTHPTLPVRSPQRGASYVRDHDVGGWDEILPTIHPCRVPDSPWGAGELTDHGELWHRPWGVSSLRLGGDEPAGVEMTVSLDAPPCRFTRDVQLDPKEPRVTLRYRFENLGGVALPYLWAAHPLLPLDPGTVIDLPRGTVVRCAEGLGEDLPVMGVPFEWPMAPTPAGGTTDLGRVEPRLAGSPGRAVKVFTERFPDELGWASVVAPDRSEALRISFDTRDVPCLGLWINDGGWAGVGAVPYRNLGVEPTSSPDDVLGVAIARGTAAVLPPGAAREWSLDLCLITMD